MSRPLNAELAHAKLLHDFSDANAELLKFQMLPAQAVFEMWCPEGGSRVQMVTCFGFAVGQCPLDICRHREKRDSRSMFCSIPC